ncbi:asparagine synthase (glutamine-hydrolyzing) [Psychrobacillus sp. NPDC096623]|uniref:asparagine synthase (glutamine-hydrolyzing) n=1 Tax=Psychrobacillus sp. NPDC096623 TaxID=3364492 RepID=UPI00381A9D74
MCGIAGIVGIDYTDKIELRGYNMIQSLKHRGPDHIEVNKIEDNCILAHARLSIIDLEIASNQPMTSQNNRWSIVFNGEILNYKEIKKELNYSFQTSGDTEVILASVQEKGINWFLENANGMFSIALYDRELKQTYLIRDRLSIKPLYYTVDKKKLIFGSEIKAILNSGLYEPELFEDAIDEYLGNRYVREPFTFFKNIFQVCGGEYLIFDKDLKCENVKYYELPHHNFDTVFDEESLIQLTKEEIEKTIKRWAISDVNVGAYLSGGVDSSLTTAILSKNSERKLQTYTIGFQDNNEFVYSDIVANRYGTSHHKIILDFSDYYNEWAKLIKFSDSPLGVPNEIPLAIMSEKLSRDITVVISGEGADELFGGYGKIYRYPFDYNNQNLKDVDFYHNFIKKYEYVSRDFRDEYLNTSKNLRAYFDSKISEDFSNHNNEESVFRFFQDYHVKGLLKRVDTTTMKASVEARPPFLDHELIEFVNTHIPYTLKLRWVSENDEHLARFEDANLYSEERDIPKYILKKVAEDYLPYEVIYRNKVGFPVPLSEWFNELSEMAIEILKESNWLEQDKLTFLIEDAKVNQRSGQIIWMFLNVELFIREYFNKNWSY